jgi:hypothetical protein
MSRSEISTEFNTFVGGILTEANPINFPPGFSLDEENFVLLGNGTRQRRFGTKLDTSSLDFDAKALAVFTATTTPVFKKHYILNDIQWGDNRQTVLALVYKYGSGTNPRTVEGILFYSLTDSTDISGNYLGFTTASGVIQDLSDYNGGVSSPYRNSNDPGAIFGSDIEGLVRVRDDSVDNWKTSLSSLRIRDFAGTESESIDTRPATLSDDHAYNLANQGWTRANVNTWFAFAGNYPSLADAQSYYKNFGSAFSTSIMNNSILGNSRAPRGQQIITAFYPYLDWQNGVFQTTLTVPTGTPDFGLESASETQNVASTLFDNGRMFYLCNAGRLLSNGSTFLLYSQSTSNAKSFTQCYQENDPTSESLSDVIATDGGSLDVSRLGEGIKLESSRSRVIMFGSKGVSELFSAQDIFTPTSINVRQISTNAIHYDKVEETILTLGTDKTMFEYTAESSVVAGDNIFYWSAAGVTALVFDTRNNQYVEENITKNTIDTLYKQIPTKCKAYAQGIYLPEDNTVAWCYSLDESNPDRLTHMLCYDLVLKAWFKFAFTNTANTYIAGIFKSPLVSDLSGRSDKFKQLTFLIRTVDNGLVTSYPVSTSFQDYVDSSDVSETQAFLQTGYLNANDSSKFKQSNYIVPSFLRTEDGFTDDGSGNLTANNESSCTISAWWDYAEEDTNTKVNPPFEAYRLNKVYIPTGPADTFDYGQSVITTKNRLTGRGRALSLRFETSIGKDCRLLGWNLGFGAVGKV